MKNSWLLFTLVFLLPLAMTFAENDSLSVEFQLDASAAKQVTVAGSFNNWDAGANPLQKSDGIWTAALRLPVGYCYYKFVVDGNWIPDPSNPLKINDGCDGYNSILKVGNPPRFKRRKSNLPFPKEQLPRPILESNPEWIELYYAAWEMAWNKIASGTPQNGFAERFMDEGFNGLIFQWDTCFMILFGVYGRDVFPVMASLDNFYNKQRDDGYIQRVYLETDGEPAGEPTKDEPMVNPPLFAWVELRYYQISGDTSRIARALPSLMKYFDWIEENCKSPEGKGLYYTSHLGSGMDNTPRFNIEQAGWIDFTAQQALAAKCIAKLAQIHGDVLLETQFSERYQNISDKINQLCWSDSLQFYFDRTRGDTLCNTKHIGAFWTLLAGIVDSNRADAMVKHLKNPQEFWRPHLLPTLSADDLHYVPEGHYWRGSVWAPTNYMVVKGLAECGYYELANEIAMNHLTAMTRVYRDFKPDVEKIAFEERYEDGYHTIWECYSAEYLSPATRWDNTFYSRQDFVGWSGLGPIAMLIENVLGINLNGAQNTLRWRLHRTDRHGIKNLTLRNQNVSLLCEPQTKNLQIRVTAEAPFMLEIHYQNQTYQQNISQAGITSFLIER